MKTDQQSSFSLSTTPPPPTPHHPSPLRLLSRCLWTSCWLVRWTDKMWNYTN
jgi:hypothetical protein